VAKTKFIRIRCQNCQHWFPSPIFFEDSASFDSSMLFGNRARCPSCRQWTSCDKENFHARFEDGGFIGADVTFDE
jgi:hypothetical protein